MFRPAKYVRVYALQDKVSFPHAVYFRIQSHQEGVIDIAITKFPGIYDSSLPDELPGSGDNITQDIASESSNVYLRAAWSRPYGPLRSALQPVLLCSRPRQQPQSDSQTFALRLRLQRCLECSSHTSH